MKGQAPRLLLGRLAPHPAVLITLAIIVGVLALPFLFGFVHSIGSLFGPPAIWDRPSAVARVEDLAGRYDESSRNLYPSYDGPKAAVELNRDGTMLVSHLPYQQIDQGYCELSGTGYWSGSSDGEHLDLQLVTAEGPNVCPPKRYAALAIAGHKRPFALFWIVSDPDSGTGVWLASNR